MMQKLKTIWNRFITKLLFQDIEPKSEFDDLGGTDHSNKKANKVAEKAHKNFINNIKKRGLELPYKEYVRSGDIFNQKYVGHDTPMHKLIPNSLKSEEGIRRMRELAFMSMRKEVKFNEDTKNILNAKLNYYMDRIMMLIKEGKRSQMEKEAQRIEKEIKDDEDFSLEAADYYKNWLNDDYINRILKDGQTG